MKDNVTWEEAVLWLRAQPEQQELVRACYYDDPLIEAAVRYEASEEWQATLNILPSEKGRALDLGAGRGISSYALAHAGWQVDALEPDPSSVVGQGAIKQLAGEANLPIKVVDGFAESIPVENAVYDLVYGRQVMHHARNLELMCKESARVLKPGGLFIATREHVISNKEDLHVFLNNHPLHHLYGGENAFLLKEYLISLKTSGLQVVKVFLPFDTPVNYFPFSQFEVIQAIQSPLIKRVGNASAKKIAGNDWDGSLNRLLRFIANWRNNSPGRLYSFVTQKP